MHIGFGIRVVGVVLLAAVAAGCAVAPRTSVWEAPSRFDTSQVFDAGLQAGSQAGWQAVSSDRTSGTMSFKKPMGAQEMNLSTSIRPANEKVQVRSTVNISQVGETMFFGAGKGQHEFYINQFHKLLFQNLGVVDPAEQSLNVEIAQ